MNDSWKITLGELDLKMGVTILEQSAERVVATMPVEGNRQSFGLLHGGASVAFAEALGSWAAVIHAGPGDGSTRHLPALKQGLAMVPEVIFFLTDADDPSLTMPQLLEIQRRADLARTTIHTIQFKVGPASNDGSWIRELALMNRGTYTYIDVTSLNSPLEKRTAE